MPPTARIVVGITGASGAVYAQRTIQLLVAAGVETHLVVSPLGQRLLHDELGMEGIDLPALAGLQDPRPVAERDRDQELAASSGGRVILHNVRDVGAAIASGSFRHDGMIIVPCSNNSLAAVATGASQNLLHRAASVCLKERRRLVLVHRETPLSLVEIRNMQTATEAGAIVMPANPGFYMLPRSIADLVDHVVARGLDLLGIDHGLQHIRWSEDQPAGDPASSPSGSPHR